MALRFWQFDDMHTGGRSKVAEHPSGFVVAAVSEAAAADYVRRRFGVEPFAVSCRCCGPDYCSGEVDGEFFDAKDVLGKALPVFYA